MTRPADYIWRGTRITHYRNHAGEWQSCPATPEHHGALQAGCRHTLDVTKFFRASGVIFTGSGPSCDYGHGHSGAHHNRDHLVTWGPSFTKEVTV